MAVAKHKNKELDAIAALVPITYRKGWPPCIRHLTGKMLRQLLKAGTVTYLQFRGPAGEFALEFLEEYPHFLAQGYIHNIDGIIFLDIDTIIGGEKTEENADGSLRIVTHKQDFTKEEIFAFANLFHYADEFEIGKNFARAWFD